MWLSYPCAYSYHSANSFWHIVLVSIATFLPLLADFCDGWKEVATRIGAIQILTGEIGGGERYPVSKQRRILLPPIRRKFSCSHHALRMVTMHLKTSLIHGVRLKKAPRRFMNKSWRTYVEQLKRWFDCRILELHLLNHGGMTISVTR